MRLVTDGQQHVVVILDEELVARFPRDEQAIESLRGEARLLSHLAGRVSAPLPVSVHVDESFTELEAVSFAHTPSLIHGDLAPYRLLHDPESGQFTGVLAFGVAGLGDPATDLAFLLSVWASASQGVSRTSGRSPRSH